MKKTLRGKFLVVLLFVVVIGFSGLLKVNFVKASVGMALHTVGHKVLLSDNSEVYFRGLGRTDMASLAGVWGGVGESAFSLDFKWLHGGTVDMDGLRQRMDDTFSRYQSEWHVNFVRFFVSADWWWSDSVWADSPGYGGPHILISERNYVELMIQEAAKYNIYVDFCPWNTYNYYDAIGKSLGFPGNWTTDDLAFLSTINGNPVVAWEQWWLSVVDRLGVYPNVVFEMWNEPYGDGAARSAWFASSEDIYSTIRGAGYSNLIFTQWEQNLVPGIVDMAWMGDYYSALKSHLGGVEPVNQVYTWHAYRYSWNDVEWATSYSGVLAQVNGTGWIHYTRSGGLNLPVVMNEAGVGMDLTGSVFTSEMSWWDSLIKVCHDLDIGFVAWYWTPQLGWSPDEALLNTGDWDYGSNSWVPNVAGQIFIDGYVSPTSNPAAIDFNHDGKVDIEDVTYFVDAYIHFHQNGTLDPTCDLNHDGKIDSSDITTFVSVYIIMQGK